MGNAQRNSLLKKDSGISLVGLLISLAIASFLMVLIAQTVTSFLSTSATETGIAAVNRKSVRLSSDLKYLLHNAGFGLPSLSGCPGKTFVGNIDETLGTEYPVSAQSETASEYGPATMPGDMDTLTVMYGHSITGSSVMARIVSLPSTDSSVVKTSTGQGISAGDGFIVNIPGKTCMWLTDTGVSGNSGSFSNWEFNHSNPSNPPNGIASLLEYMAENNIGDSNLSSSDFGSARLLIAGISTSERWYLQGQTLMGHFVTTGADQPTITNAEIMNGVLAFRVMLGTGNDGYITYWMTPTQWQAEAVNNRPEILAVRVGYILVSRSESSQVQTPKTIKMMNTDYNVPAADDGHIVKAYQVTLPVENNIWSE